ncbi:MAG: ATP-binding protein [Oscillospiraceae bacterium]|nr:ATP-binding protein [Oscillospiraceae bacterium]
MRQLEGKVRRALDMYGMIDAGDRVGVGVSGGKDSLALLCLLAALRRYYQTPYELVALSLDPCFGGAQTDFAPVTALCESLGVEHIVKRTNLGEVVFETRAESNPCSLCARMRRGALHDLCVANGCNKIALGHHMDDAVETFFMNLFHEGRVASFSPKSYLSKKNITLIRPLVLCTEAELRNAAARSALPVVKSRCPRDGYTERQRMKEFIAQKETDYPGFLRRTFTALQSAHISGF